MVKPITLKKNKQTYLIYSQNIIYCAENEHQNGTWLHRALNAAHNA
jgi:hypothetical protein